MQQVLRHYNRLPANINDRAALFTNLFDHSRDLGEEESASIRDWLRAGGAFQQPAQSQVTGAEGVAEDMDTAIDDEGHWPVYNEHYYDGDNGVDEEFEDEDEHSEYERGSSVDSRDLTPPPHVPENSPEALHPRTHREISEESDMTDLEDAEAEDLAHLGVHPRENEMVDLENLETVDWQSISMRPGDDSPLVPDGKLECAICCEACDAEDLPDLVIPNCKHRAQVKVCIACIRYYIDERLNEGIVAIRCPLCNQSMESDQIKGYATPEVFARYQYLVDVSNPDIIMCLGLNCGKGQFHKDQGPLMICNSCSFKTCTFHKLPWQEGKTCEEFDTEDSQIERLEQAEATARLLATERAQVCPNCHQGVSRIDGCDHMTCRCGMERCYLCGVSFDLVKAQGDIAHARTCIYHPRSTAYMPARDHKRTLAGHLSEIVHGVPGSDTLARARATRNERIREDMRPRLAEAAEKRVKEAEKKRKEAEREREKVARLRRRRRPICMRLGRRDDFVVAGWGGLLGCVVGNILALVVLSRSGDTLYYLYACK